VCHFCSTDDTDVIDDPDEDTAADIAAEVSPEKLVATMLGHVRTWMKAVIFLTSYRLCGQ
jgi:hypothetical protein